MAPPKTLRRRIKHARRMLLYYILRACYGVLRFMPRWVLQSIAATIAACMYLLDWRFKDIMRSNLLRAFPERSAAFRERVARRSFWNLGRSAVDTLVAYRHRDRPIGERVPRRPGDIERWCGAFVQEGAIVVGGHVGCWELSAFGLSQAQPGRIAVMAKRIYFPPFNDWVVSIREAFGLHVFYQDERPLGVVRFLRKKNFLGILPDQDLKDVAGIFVPFFGVDAWTPTGPVTLALMAGVPIYVASYVWEKNRYELLCEGPLPFPNTGSREEDTRILTEAWTRILERTIRKYPDQWVWFHRRWKTRPPGAPPR